MMNLYIVTTHSRVVREVAWISQWWICALLWLDFYHKDVFITNLLGVIFDQTGMV